MKSQKKVFLAVGLCIVCAGVLLACFLMTRDRAPEFTPDPVQTDTPSDWEENNSRTDNGEYAAGGNSPAVSDEEYPKETQDADGNVDIEFTPSSDDLKPDAPEAPTTDADNTDPAAPPAYTPEEVQPPAVSEPPASNTPEPGSRREDGAVYDRVFGWIMPSDVEQTPIDSEGDLNKMVGEMGP